MLHLGFVQGGGVIYVFHGGQLPDLISKVYHNLEGSGGIPPGNFLEFEHPEITPGAFLDQLQIIALSTILEQPTKGLKCV